MSCSVGSGASSRLSDDLIFNPLGQCLKRCNELTITPTEYIILVQAATKTLELWHNQELVRTYPISTGKNGIGQDAGSGKTPLGLHKIKEKIGEGADPLSVFESRCLMPDIVALPSEGKRYIVARILRLEGLEEGYNKGTRFSVPAALGENPVTCVDSFERYIYIHGTNYASEVGKEDNTAGCICMKPEDVIDLFEIIPEKSLVYVSDKSPSELVQSCGPAKL